MTNSRTCLTVLALAVLLCGACAADVQLRNPQTGEVATCPGGYSTRGAIGMMAQTAKDVQFKCIDDYRAQGYVRVPQ